MTHGVRAIVLACLLVLAGCTLPFGGDQTPTPEPTQTASPTPTPEPEDPYPPGVSETVLDNSTQLLNAHVETITETGYEATAQVNTTVERASFLIEAESFARTTVAANASAYYEQRQTLGGPVERTESRWSNGSVEFVRTQENGDVGYEREETRHRGVLAGRPVLEPYLNGSNFTVDTVNETSDPATVTLVADEVDDEEALREGLPDETQEVRWLNATMVVDEAGRILSMEVSVGIVIGGEDRIHQVTYSIESIGGVDVDRPDWIEEAEAES